MNSGRLTKSNRLSMISKSGAVLLIFSLAVLVTSVILVASVYLGVFGPLQSKAGLQDYKNATASLILSEEGELIGKFYSENRTNISYDQIPSHLINAVIATEDARFMEHKGLDARSLTRVLIKSVLFNERSAGGGSTITQQLAKNMFGRKNFGPVTILINKLKEVILARRIEKSFRKEEILTLYLNTVSFGENVYGIEAASERYFNKNAAELKPEESAVLTGMLKANTFYNPRLYPENAKKRRNIVLKQMEKYCYLTPAVTDSLCEMPLIIDYNNYEAGGPADYFLVQVRHETEKILQDIYNLTGIQWDIETDGLKITTTLNLALQKYAAASFRDHLPLMQQRLRDQYNTVHGRRSIEKLTNQELQRLKLSAREKEIRYQKVFGWKGSYNDTLTVKDSLRISLTLLHAGFMALDPLTGNVRAWVGGIDFKTQPYDQVLARRQLASIFKPFLYVTALEEGMEPCQYLNNDSVTLSGLNDWSPENYDHSYGGKYSLAGALAQSMNVPAFSLFRDLGFEKIDSLWRRMGFSFTLDNTPSLAMGTAEANIREVAAAYSAFVNGGFKIDPVIIQSIKTSGGEIIYENRLPDDSERVITERSSLLMCAMLQKAAAEGTGAAVRNVYGVNVPLAGKTGTSQNYADAWFAAFTPRLVLVTRVGASTPAVHFNTGIYGSGSTLALPLIALTLKRIQADRNLSESYIDSFPGLPPELAYALDCPDFREKSLFERIMEIFEKDGRIRDRYDYKPRPGKKPFFKRLFKR